MDAPTSKWNSMQASVDVIIVNYNGRHFLQDCLPSLGAQTFRDFETFVVDNGSTDDSVQFVRVNFPWVRVIALEQNLGFSGGNNFAIKKTTGEFIALLNNDTVVEPSWLEELMQAMRARPDAGICASRILYIAQPGILYAAGDSYTAYGSAFRRGDKEPIAGRFEQAGEVFSACACAALYRRSMLEEVGLFDEDFFSNCEDVDIGFRARLAGYVCLYWPQAIVYHHGSGTTGIGNARVEFLTSRNFEYVFFKNVPLPLLLRYLPFHVLHAVWTLLKRSRAGLGVPYLKGKIAFLANLRSTLRKRAVVQKMRRMPAGQLLMAMDSGVFPKFIFKFKLLWPRSRRTVKRSSEGVHRLD